MPPKKFIPLNDYLDKQPEDPRKVKNQFGGYFNKPQGQYNTNNNTNNNYNNNYNNNNNNTSNTSNKSYSNNTTNNYNNNNNGYQPYINNNNNNNNSNQAGYQAYRANNNGYQPYINTNATSTYNPNDREGSITPKEFQKTSSSASLSSTLSKLEIKDDTPITDLLNDLAMQATIQDCKKKLVECIDIMKQENPTDPGMLVSQWNVAGMISKLNKPKNSALVRESSNLFISLLASQLISGQYPFECYLLELVPLALDSFSDKSDSVKREAQHALDSIYGCFPQEGLVARFLPTICEFLEDSSAKWQSKVQALKTIDKLREECSNDMLELSFKNTIPVLIDMSTDFKPELNKQGYKTLFQFVSILDNLDLQPRLELIVKTLQDPAKVPDCIKALSSVTFVAEVTEPVLSLLVPILNRSLKTIGSSSQEQLRQTVIVVENLTRLVNNHIEIESYIPLLEPGVQKVVDTAALPEVRELATKALSVLKDDTELKNGKFPGRITAEQAKNFLLNADLGDFKSTLEKQDNFVVQDYLTNLVMMDANVNDWQNLKTYFSLFINDSEKVDHFVKTIRKTFDHKRGVSNEDDEEGAVEIVNADFSLAYGSRMLLNKTNLRLLKGHRYGLCGRNGCGKSTLMRSISKGQLEGFPTADQVKTCFVEHKIQESEADMDLVAFIASDPELDSSSNEEIADALEKVGFNEERRTQTVGSLSGGWKMKLELARAMLLQADVLLLDEPTNHLDVANVQWLKNYLLEHTEITSLIVSHDTGFLDAVCTDIIHYENKKLAYYKGNLHAFVVQKPEAKAYYTLTDSNASMRFPPPGILTGVKSNTRSVCKMTDVSFSYPNSSKISLEHVSASLSLSSRVAVLGPNGAGKSTLIKLLTGELVPNSGKVEKHPNLRFGYIAQHALQHVNEHKEKTANQYLQWRYQFGEDREVVMKESRKMSEEEKDMMVKKIDNGDGFGEREIEAIVGRQKFKKSFKYEIKWKFYKPKYNSWCSKEYLEKEGFGKLVQKFDDFEASREGLGYRELIPSVITKHFEDVGLDSEITNHTPLGSLSGGQLVKVVIAGAMWNNPHLLVLDEPTNYLDRDSLGALAVAIREWSGGVVMISHNSEFVGALCPEQWHVADGKLVQKGIAQVDQSKFEDGGNENAHGLNVSKPADDDDNFLANLKVKRRKKKMTRNEKKLQVERRRLRYIEWLSSPKGTPKPVNTDDEDEDDEEEEPKKA